MLTKQQAYQQMAQLCIKRKRFKKFLDEIETNFDNYFELVKRKRRVKSVKILKIFGVKMTDDEKELLQTYLTYKYQKHFKGDVITFKKYRMVLVAVYDFFSIYCMS